MGAPPNTAETKEDHSSALPAYAILGLVILLLSWALSWGLSGLRTHLFFFPQWVGYCLLVSGIVQRRKGSCLLTRNPAAYLLLFLVSMPVWWLFEGLNIFTQNWIYLGREAFSGTDYFLYSSLSFSTVIPAVFSTAELIGTFSWPKKLGKCPGFHLDSRRLWILHGSGWGMLILMILFPDKFFPVMWLSIFFIIDPLNARFRRPSLIKQLSAGKGQALVVFGAAALLCGFFWELWNLYAYPKWIYSIPYLDFLHVFEMPLAGYGGYIPFGWELYAVYHLLSARRNWLS